MMTPEEVLQFIVEKMTLADIARLETNPVSCQEGASIVEDFLADPRAPIFRCHLCSWWCWRGQN